MRLYGSRTWEDEDQSAQEKPELKIARLCEGVRYQGTLLPHGGILAIHALSRRLARQHGASLHGAGLRGAGLQHFPGSGFFVGISHWYPTQ